MKDTTTGTNQVDAPCVAAGFAKFASILYDPMTPSGRAFVGELKWRYEYCRELMTRTTVTFPPALATFDAFAGIYKQYTSNFGALCVEWGNNELFGYKARVHVRELA
jgi:hypothetical protein